MDILKRLLYIICTILYFGLVVLCIIPTLLEYVLLGTDIIYQKITDLETLIDEIL